jgi:hypothetical protein
MKEQTIQDSKGRNDSIPKLAYTPAEAGAAIGRDKSWIYRQIYTGNLRVSASFGRRAMIPATELERFVNTLGETKFGTSAAGHAGRLWTRRAWPNQLNPKTQ